ncbi:MAG: hypothetical protein U1E51_28065 [Candidatus Binatia bacterium]|nr:hypothetical protein [Candidatus Binatia bacterium]
MADITINHTCMVYCRPDLGEHTELVYTDEAATEGTLWRVLDTGEGSR